MPALRAVPSPDPAAALRAAEDAKRKRGGVIALARDTGVTYRRYRYYLAAFRPGVYDSGSGQPAAVTDDDEARMRVLCELVSAGVVLRVAVEMADRVDPYRLGPDHPPQWAQIGDRVWLTIGAVPS